MTRCVMTSHVKIAKLQGTDPLTEAGQADHCYKYDRMEADRLWRSLFDSTERKEKDPLTGSNSFQCIVRKSDCAVQ